MTIKSIYEAIEATYRSGRLRLSRESSSQSKNPKYVFKVTRKFPDTPSEIPCSVSIPKTPIKVKRPSLAEKTNSSRSERRVSRGTQIPEYVLEGCFAAFKSRN